MKNFNNDYYAGFDIGTDSVGYAVADTDYNLCKFKGNAMWGVDLFEESNSAAERRTLRSARRRGLRKETVLNGCRCFLMRKFLKLIMLFIRD